MKLPKNIQAADKTFAQLTLMFNNLNTVEQNKVRQNILDTFFWTVEKDYAFAGILPHNTFDNETVETLLQEIKSL